MKRILIVALVLAGVIDYSLALNEAGDKDTLQVVTPASLKRTSDFKHSEALFGIPRYGANNKITGELMYLTANDNQDGCDPYTVPKPNKKGPYIFLIDRGDCAFVTKVRNAQQLGASAVIIVDNVCQCENAHAAEEATGHTKAMLQKCKSQAANARTNFGRILPETDCDTRLPFMSGDGKTGDIAITGFLVDFYDGQLFKDCYLTATNPSYVSITNYNCSANDKLIVSMTWDLPKPDNNVEYDIWTSSDSQAVFKRDFKKIAVLLKDYTTFTPHYFVWDGEYFGCTIGEQCGNQCTPGGYYCNPDPDKEIGKGVSGRDVIEEDLRQLCIWQQAKKDLRKDAGSMWWNYTVLFADECHKTEIPTEKFFNAACSEKIHAKIPGLSWEATQKCVRESWISPKKNTLLDIEIAAREELKIFTLPTGVVNNVILRGGVSSASMLASICAGFEDGSTPALCNCVNSATSTQLFDCVESLCDTGSIYCDLDNHCYPKSDYAVQCNSACGAGYSYCLSIQACISRDQKCPVCLDPQNPFYCENSKSCKPSGEACLANIAEGMSVFGVIVLVTFVALILGGIGYVYTRRQRRKMREELRNILSEYMPLEEFEGRPRPSGGQTTNPSGSTAVPTITTNEPAITAPSPSNSNGYVAPRTDALGLI